MPQKEFDLSEIQDSAGQPQTGGFDLSELSASEASKIPTEETPENTGYEGIPDDKLSWYQKLEKKYTEIDPRVKGHELFSPQALAQKKAKLPYIAGGLLMATGGAGLLGEASPALSLAFPEAVGTEGVGVAGAARGLVMKYGPKVLKHAAMLGGEGLILKHILGEGHGE